jgi:hypothetical protein
MYKFAPRLFLGLSLGIVSLAGAVVITGCHNGAQTAATPDNSGPDPADANTAQVGNPDDQSAPAPAPAPAPGRVQGQRSAYTPGQTPEQYAQQNPQQSAPAPVYQQQPDQTDQGYDYNSPSYDDNQVDAGQQALEQANEPPPPLPTYDQPQAPAPNYLWTPGYWSYAPTGYYWVPGAWCAPPFYGALWTPGYWGFFNAVYVFHSGYWGPHIGFYGGVNYGYGYTGSGYHGGYWQGNNFYYNRSVNNINTTRITNVYNRTVIVNNNYNRVSYNGGRGGIPVRPQPAEIAAARGPRVPPMSTQLALQRQSAQNREQFYNTNKGRPAIAAAPRPVMAQQGIRQPAGFQQARPNVGVQPANRPQVENRPAQPATRPVQPETRPAQPQTRPTQPETRPNQPQTRPNQPETRPNQPATRPAQPLQNRPQPEIKPVQPRPAMPQTQNRPAQPQPQTRPAQPQPQTRPAQPQPQPQSRPAEPQSRPVQPQTRPTEPQPQARPAEPQSRPAQPQPQQRPAPQSRPAQPQSKPAPQAQPHEAPHSEPHQQHR